MLHAYILTGSREAAVERARELAAEALCRGSRPGRAAPAVPARKVFRGVHPDVTVVERRTDESGKPRKEILVDQIRALSAEAVVRPNEGSARVYIFPEAEAMNTSAQNAFLKLLEEPPVQAYFLLCAEDPERLLETVRSRCAQLRLGGAAAAAGKKVRDRRGPFWRRWEIRRSCCAAVWAWRSWTLPRRWRRFAASGRQRRNGICRRRSCWRWRRTWPGRRRFCRGTWACGM